MPPFTLTPCTPSDLEGMVAVYLHAFTTTHINKTIFPPATCSVEDQARWLRARFGRLLSGIQPEMRFFKLTDQETGTLAAWARWGYPISSLTDEERKKWEAEREKEKEKIRREKGTHEAQAVQDEDGSASARLSHASPPKWPAGANEEACERYFGTLDQKRETHLRCAEDYILYFLATDPAYQGRGLGTTLLDHGIARAEAEGRRIYLEATEMGHALYGRLGWGDVELVAVDFTPWGVERPGVHYIMVREPRAET